MLYVIKIESLDDGQIWTHARNVYWEEIERAEDDARTMWNPEGYRVFTEVQDSGYQNPYANIEDEDES